MKIVIIGANGYLGSAITSALARAGHEVVPAGRARNGATRGESFRVVDLTDTSTLVDAITPDIDAVVHAGAPLGDWSVDRGAVATMLAQLQGPERRLVYVSGAWVLGPTAGSPLDEKSPPRPIGLVSGRESVEEVVLASRVRGVVIRPGVVHGHGGGIPSLMTSWAAENKHGRYVVERTDAPTWAAVHVEDLADLVGLALTEARRGDILHAVAEEAVSVRDVAVAADLATGGSGVATAWPLAEASVSLGDDFARALATSQWVTSARGRELGWVPKGPGLVGDVATGSYVDIARARA
jgi:nucleoside-diphosphate-sugar epimerase